MIDYAISDWSQSLDSQGYSGGPTGYFLIGFYRSNCGKLYCIEKALYGLGNWGPRTLTLYNNWSNNFSTNYGIGICSAGYGITSIYRNSLTGSETRDVDFINHLVGALGSQT